MSTCIGSAIWWPAKQVPMVELKKPKNLPLPWFVDQFFGVHMSSSFEKKEDKFTRLRIVVARDANIMWFSSARWHFFGFKKRHEHYCRLITSNFKGKLLILVSKPMNCIAKVILEFRSLGVSIHFVVCTIIQDCCIKFDTHYIVNDK